MPGPRPKPRVLDFPVDRQVVEPVEPARYVSYHMLELRVLDRATGRYRPWTVAEIAKAMGVGVTTVHNLRSSGALDRLSPTMCLALERLTGVRAENWAELQWRYDLWKARSATRAG